MRRILLAADLGGPEDVHLGDEAMFEANLSLLRSVDPAARFVAVSSDPPASAALYGVQALPLPSFPGALPPLPWDEDAALRAASQWGIGRELSDAVGECDAVVISGGGNLCSTWPDKLAERVGLIHCAADRGRPAIVLGQTLGPQLAERERAFLGAALRRAAWVGVRESSSAALAVELGVAPEHVHLQLDDAFCLPPRRAASLRAERLRRRPKPWIVVSMDASWGSDENASILAALAAQLAVIARTLGGSLLFVPHVGGSAVPASRSDEALGARLRDRLGLDIEVLPPWPAAEVRWLTGQAALVIASRYHAVVFALAAAVPVLAIHSDAYTRAKLCGALEHAGLAGWSLPLESVGRGQLVLTTRELLRVRSDVRRRMREQIARADPECRERAVHLGALLGLAAPPSARPQGGPGNRSSRGGTITMPPIATTHPPIELDEAAWHEYDRRGYLRLGRVLDDAALTALQRRIDEIMLGQVSYPQLQFQMDTGGAYEDLPDPVTGLIRPTLAYRKVQGLEADPLFLDLLRRDLFREICAWHYGAHASVSIFRAMLMNKPASQGTYLPWHQDAGDVWKLDRDPEVTLWVALDAATKENGCIQVVPGTHKLGLLSRNGSTISDENVARHCPESAIEYLEIGAGEGLLLHNWLLHRSDVNRTDKPRRAFTACYMDGRTLNTMTGKRFPVIFGEPEDTEAAMPFLRVVNEENRALRHAAAEAERYARSLEQENAALRGMRSEAETYAHSLAAELERVRASRRGFFGLGRRG